MLKSYFMAIKFEICSNSNFPTGLSFINSLNKIYLQYRDNE